MFGVKTLSFNFRALSSTKLLCFSQVQPLTDRPLLTNLKSSNAPFFFSGNTAQTKFGQVIAVYKKLDLSGKMLLLYHNLKV